MASRFLRQVSCLLVAGAVMLSSGCSLLNPYVRAKELDEHSGAQKPPSSSALSHAVTAAQAQRKAYYSAVSDRAKLRNGLPLVLVPLGAAAFYKGIAGDTGESTRKVLLREGLLGAGLFGLGNYYTSTPREQIYLAGAKALSCSIYAATPYYLPDALAKEMATEKVQALFVKISEVEARAIAVRDIRRAASDPGTITMLDAVLASSDASVVSAKAALRQAVATQAQFDAAGAHLLAAVENIVNQVDVQLSQMEPEPSTILMVVDGLAANAKRLVPAGNFGAASAASSANAAPALGVAASPHATAIQSLIDERKKLDASVANLQFALDVIAERVKAVPAMPTCQMKASQGHIDVSPEEPQQIEVGKTSQIIVRSNTGGIPTIEWVGTIHPKIELTKTLSGQSVLVLVHYKEAVEGISTVTLEAANSTAKKQIQLNLVQAAEQTKAPVLAPPAPIATDRAGAVSPTETADRGGARNAVEKGLLGDQLKAIQQKLKVSPTGVFDAATRTAIKAWKAGRGIPGDDSLQTAIIADIKK